MDTATIIVVCAAAASIVTAFFVHRFGGRIVRKQGILFGWFAAVWAIMTLGGEFLYSWAGNTTCSPYLGCVEGFGGYDFFEHLFFGIAAALALVWLFEKFPKYSIFHDERWKTALTIIAIVALISVLWEIGECVHDYFRLDILHDHYLLNLRLHINKLDQPTNLDTMGDLTASLVGSLAGFFLSAYKKIRP